MKQITTSQTFLSLEGEGPLTGTPTYYIRTAGCNFRCKGFNNPDGYTEEAQIIGFNPKDYKSLRELPSITRGCDTGYAVYPSFKHIWTKVTWEEALKDYRPGDNLSITGGEPSLWQTQIAEFLMSPLSDGIPNIIFETNCSVDLDDEFIAAINDWTLRNASSEWWWSNSPKLAISGEPRNKAIRPDIAAKQLEAHAMQYFKFVTDGSDDSLAEVKDVVEQYAKKINTSADPIKFKIWLMPMACDKKQQDIIATKVADICVERQYNFAYRLQNQIWDNDVEA